MHDTYISSKLWNHVKPCSTLQIRNQAGPMRIKSNTNKHRERSKKIQHEKIRHQKEETSCQRAKLIRIEIHSGNSFVLVIKCQT